MSFAFAFYLIFRSPSTFFVYKTFRRRCEMHATFVPQKFPCIHMCRGVYASGAADWVRQVSLLPAASLPLLPEVLLHHSCHLTPRLSHGRPGILLPPVSTTTSAVMIQYVHERYRVNKWKCNGLLASKRECVNCGGFIRVVY